MGRRGSGRARKRSKEEEEESEGESGHLTPTATAGQQQAPNLASPPQGIFSAPAHYPSAPPRYLTRNAKAALDKCATLTTPLRHAVRSVKGIPSHCSIWTPTKRVPEEMTDISSPATKDIPTSENFTSVLPLQTQVLNSPAASLRYHSQHVKTTPTHTSILMLEKWGKITDDLSNSMSAESEDWSNPTNDVLDLEKLASKLLSQTRGPEKLPTDPHSAFHDVVFDNHLPVREANVASSIIGDKPEESANTCNQKDEHPSQSLSLNLTEMAKMLDDDSYDPDEVGSALNSALVTVNGYRVKPELAPLLRAIFSKHNDIAKGSSFQSISIRSSLLEIVCGICQKLQHTEFTHITPDELKSMIDIVGDLKSANLEVGWLHQRLDEISEAMRLFMGYSTLKEAKTKIIEITEREEKELEGYKAEMLMLQEKICSAEDKLAATKAQAEKLNETVSNTKAKVKCFYQRSLVDGLI